LVGIDHHEGQPPVAIVRVLAGENADALFLVVGEPMVTRHPGVVFVDLAKACFPVVELAGADADPAEEMRDRDLGPVAPRADEIDDLVARVVSNPEAL
jgi:hypothetical protein